jgi:hypothetical protein
MGYCRNVFDTNIYCNTVPNLLTVVQDATVMTCTQLVTCQVCLVLIYLTYRREYYLPWSEIRTRDPNVTGIQMWLVYVIEESVIFGLLPFLKLKSSFQDARHVFYVYPDVP